MNQKRISNSDDSEENESESYDVAAHIGIFSFLWGVSCRSVRILVSRILYTF